MHRGAARSTVTESAALRGAASGDSATVELDNGAGASCGPALSDRVVDEDLTGRPSAPASTRGAHRRSPQRSLCSNKVDLHGHLSLSASPSWSASSRAVTILAGRPLDSHPRPLRRQRIQRAALGDLAGAQVRPRPPPQGWSVAVAALCMMRLELSAAQIPPTGSCSGGVGPQTAPGQAGRQGRLSRVNIAPTGLPSGQASGGGAALVRRRPTGDRGLSHR